MADLDKRITEFTKDCTEDNIKKLIEDLGFDSSNPGGSQSLFNIRLANMLGKEIDRAFTPEMILKLLK